MTNKRYSGQNMLISGEDRTQGKKPINWRILMMETSKQTVLSSNYIHGLWVRKQAHPNILRVVPAPIFTICKSVYTFFCFFSLTLSFKLSFNKKELHLYLMLFISEYDCCIYNKCFVHLFKEYATFVIWGVYSMWLKKPAADQLVC